MPHTPGAFKDILFCTDFSENADFAFDYAVDIAKRRPGSVLHLLHVIPEPDAQFWQTYLHDVEGVDEKARQEILEKIERSYRSRVPEGVEMEVYLRVGKADAEILKTAEEVGADLLMMGRQGSSSWGTLLFGKVTENIARHANCAVLIIPFSYERRVENTPDAGGTSGDDASMR
jgi:nucleotide-binding universal stress UspA family protein